MTDESVSDLLEGLASPDPGPAWTEFLQRYSATILRIIRRYETDHGRVEDGYQHVCAVLSDHKFQRLLKYRQDTPASFRTWLMAVTANLCIDWRRKKRGRFRPVRAVERLPERDQLVYRYLYVRGLSRVDCLHMLAPRFPDLTEQEIADINARLFLLLTPQQRWQLGARTATAGPQADDLAIEIDEEAMQLEEPGPGPEDLAQSEQERVRLAAALAELPTRERLLLRLRFEQDLTLAEVARLTGLQDPFRANRQIRAALAALARLMTDPRPSTTGANRRDVSVHDE